jgi:hypothetical protein
MRNRILYIRACLELELVDLDIETKNYMIRMLGWVMQVRQIPLYKLR